MKGLDPNTTQYLRIQSYNSADVTDYSWFTLGSTSTLALPVTPNAISEVDITSVTANWAALDDNMAAGYILQASTSPAFTGIAFSSSTFFERWAKKR